MQITLLSFGGGQDSTTILLKCLHDKSFREKFVKGLLVVMCADTGDEHTPTLENIQKMEALCRHNPEVFADFIWIKKEMGFHTPAWPDLMTPQKRKPGGKFKPTMVQLGTKSCTDKLKIGPIYKCLDEWINKRFGYGYAEGASRKRALDAHCRKHGPIRVLIGYAYGEESRAKKSIKQEDKDVKTSSWKRHLQRVFPLIYVKMNRKDCQVYNEQILGRKVWPSNCMRCPYMSEAELLWLYRNHHDKYSEWVEVESAKLRRHKNHPKNHGVFGGKMTIPEKLERAKLKYGHRSLEELDDYKFSHGCATNNM